MNLPFNVPTAQYLFIILNLTGTSNTIITGNTGAPGVNVTAKIPAVNTI